MIIIILLLLKVEHVDKMETFVVGRRAAIHRFLTEMKYNKVTWIRLELHVCTRHYLLQKNERRSVVRNCYESLFVYLSIILISILS